MSTSNVSFEFYYAAKNNNADKMKELFSKNEKIEQFIRPYNQSLLLHAALNNSYDVAKYLIENSFDVNEADANKYTPLHAAAEYGFTDMAELLVKKGANVEVKDKNENTPLSIAVFNSKSDLSLIEILLKAGADPFIKNSFGQSPYTMAQNFKKPHVVEIFDENKKK